ncbi:MAG: class I SAM-dependent methyltransferase [Chthoniobacterales bacterium]|jgi:predicted SAM-dependent methyltransferase
MRLGEFINNVTAANKFAIDLNPDAAQRVNSDVQLLQQDCSVDWPLHEDSVDCVFTSNFFEHLRMKDAVEDTLAEAFRCLRPGGQIVCMGPNVRLLPGEYWDFWDHNLALTDRSLTEVLQLTGFAIERSIPQFLPHRMSGRR